MEKNDDVYLVVLEGIPLYEDVGPLDVLPPPPGQKMSGIISLEGTFPGSDPPCPGLGPDTLLLELSFPSFGGCQINFISLEGIENK